ncbi:uncharacterized protein LOC121910103, partial [Scomber scombrus]
KKRKQESDQNSADKEPETEAKFKKNKVESDSSDEEQNVAAGPRRENLQRNLPAGGSVSAEATMRSIRAEFIDRVSKSNLDQLLDKLLQCGVINDGEMESIKTGSRADKARDLIDTVRGKGNEPSSHFIAVLCELDPNLSRLLNLTESKRNKVVSDSDSSDEEQIVAAGFKKNKVVSDSDSSDEKENVAAGEKDSAMGECISLGLCSDSSRRSCLHLYCSEIPLSPFCVQRKTIKDVLSEPNSRDLGEKVVIGKVVQKSALRTYQTKDKKKRFFFYLGISDETACIQVMVYGKDRYEEFQKHSCYTFRDVIMEKSIMKVTKVSIVSKTKPIDVPEELEMEAEMLIYPQKPVCCIAKAKTYADRTAVSVEGTVTEIGPVEPVTLKKQRRKKDMKEKQEFHLKDDTGSIRITLWGKDVVQIRGISNGDFVRVTNVKTNHYYETVSLNSTDFTRICKMQSAAIQNVTAEIIGIISASLMETQLEASFNNRVEKLVVASKLLAKVFEVRLEGDLKDRLIEKIPFTANVEIQGSKINKITAIKEM